jgi:hypothetical protein
MHGLCVSRKEVRPRPVFLEQAANISDIGGVRALCPPLRSGNAEPIRPAHDDRRV